MEQHDIGEVSYLEYIQSSQWADRAKAAKRRAGYRCQICNRHEDDVILDAHHRTYERLGCEVPEDITILCRDCHELYEMHRRLGKFGGRVLAKNRDLRHAAEIAANLFDSDGLLSKQSALSIVPTGFFLLDRQFHLLQRGTVTLLAALAGDGKTSLATSIAMNAALDNRLRVLVVSLELSAEQLIQRMISARTGIEAQRLQWGDTHEEDERHRLTEAVSSFSESGLLVDDTPAMTMAQLSAKCRNAKNQVRGIDLIVIDGLGLLSTDYGPDSWASHAECSQTLKNLARELDLPIVATLSLKPNQRQDKRPTLEDVPTPWVQNSDAIVFIYCEERYVADTERLSIADIIVAKHRGGPTGTTSLYFRKELTHFIDLQITSQAEPK